MLAIPRRFEYAFIHRCCLLWAKKRIMAYSAALGGIGIQLDDKLNNENESIIWNKRGSIQIRIIRTDEEFMIAFIIMGMMN